MARGDLYNGPVRLAYDFPPSLNTDQDPTLLKPHESPSCYGVDCQKDGRLKSGSVLTGTARTAPAGTGDYTGYSWYLDRLWKANTATLNYYAPDYRAYLYEQGLGEVIADATIVTFMPAFGNQMWVVTGSGSQFIRGADNHNGNFVLGPIVQELASPTATKAITLNGLPVVCNTSGVFLHDGQKVVELTRPVRDSLGSFSSVAILADYSKRFIIGTAKFVIDTETGKLFDYGTSGFRFTTRTLAQVPAFNPMQVGSVAFVYERGSTADATISWQTKTEDGDWYSERDIELYADEGAYTRTEVGIDNPAVSCYRFQLRITALSSNIYIREIQVNVAGLAQGSFTE